MRTIPPELLNRVKKKWQVKAENADPKMKILLSRGFVNELFQVFTVQEDDQLSDIDIAVKRLDVATAPAEAFVLAVKNGAAQIKSKLLPYDDQLPWIDHFTVATNVTSVAIEFDGRWRRAPGSSRFNFVTEEFPWIFYVKSGDLYAQYWMDPPLLLAEGVTKVVAMRAWKNTFLWNHDHGIIAMYLKADGTPAYRNYCQQPDGINTIWEPERIVTELPYPAQNIGLFRTNDYRTGMLCESDGEVYWVTTERNWANMAIEAHYLTAAPVAVTMEYINVEYFEPKVENEHITAMPVGIVPYYGYTLTDNHFVEIYNQPIFVDEIEDWGKELIIRTEHELKNPASGDFELIDILDRVYLPNTIERIGDRTYKLSYLEFNNFNNAGVGVDATMRFKGLQTTNDADLIYEPFEMVFQPLGLVPTEIPLPEVEAIWNE